jgi:endonuclease YncB( thermonuclease family)
MKAWFKKFLLLFWPWSRIDELEKMLAELHGMLDRAHQRYWEAERLAFNQHLQIWMANANMLYGPEPFRDGQKKVMIDLYNRGMTAREAIDSIRIAEGRLQGWER